MEYPALRLRDYLAPRHWPTWIGVGLLRLAVLLPYPLLLGLGRAMGGLIHRLLPRRRRIAETNIALCFPELDKAAQQRLVRDTIDASAMGVLEGAFGWWGSARRFATLDRFEGEEHLQQVLAQGKGAILLGAHYTTVEVSSRLLLRHVDAETITPVFKPASNPLFDTLMTRARFGLFTTMLGNDEMRAMLRALKQNKVIWYAPDQDFGMESSVFAPFFGVPTATLTTTSRLAKLSGAPVVPYLSQRLPGNQGYLCRILPPLDNFPSGDDAADAARINQVIETQVREAPEQYLWVHRRFKSRPPGEPPLY